jgi:hypothetical protein
MNRILLILFFLLSCSANLNKVDGKVFNQPFFHKYYTLDTFEVITEKEKLISETSFSAFDSGLTKIVKYNLLNKSDGINDILKIYFFKNKFFAEKYYLGLFSPFKNNLQKLDFYNKTDKIEYFLFIDFGVIKTKNYVILINFLRTNKDNKIFNLFNIILKSIL